MNNKLISDIKVDILKIEILTNKLYRMLNELKEEIKDINKNMDKLYKEN